MQNCIQHASKVCHILEALAPDSDTSSNFRIGMCIKRNPGKYSKNPFREINQTLKISLIS